MRVRVDFAMLRDRPHYNAEMDASSMPPADPERAAPPEPAAPRELMPRGVRVAYVALSGGAAVAMAGALLIRGAPVDVALLFACLLGGMAGIWYLSCSLMLHLSSWCLKFNERFSMQFMRAHAERLHGPDYMARFHAQFKFFLWAMLLACPVMQILMAVLILFLSGEAE